MEIIRRKLRLVFSFALGLSVGFPLGILGIVFGAVLSWWVLLAVGILFVVGGFYAMPLLWVKYADLRHDRTLLSMITEERILTVSALAAQTGFPEKEVRTRILRLLQSRALIGFLFENDTLLENTKAEEEPPLYTMDCPRCAAPITSATRTFRCEYCGGTFTSEE